MKSLQYLLVPITFPLSLIYGLLIFIRNKFYDWEWFPVSKFDIPIISVGNITVGGSGKTPLVMYIATLLKKNGENPGIVSRGYGRKSQGIILVHDGKKLCTSVENAGDEPYLMASILQNIPIAVSEKRSSAIKELIDYYSVNIILLDDGYQHRSVFRDLDLITISANDKPMNYKLLPWGKLREPLKNVSRADFAIFTKTDNYNPPQNFSIIKPHLKDHPIYCTQQSILMKYDTSGYHKSLPPTQELFAFCGIGEPKSFFKSIGELELKIGGRRIFKDHQDYTKLVIKELTAQKNSSKCNAIITTEKDLVKLPDKFLEKFEIYVIKVEMEIESEGELIEYLQNILEIYNKLPQHRNTITE